MRRKVQAKDNEQERPRRIDEINGVFSVVVLGQLDTIKRMAPERSN